MIDWDSKRRVHCLERAFLKRALTTPRSLKDPLQADPVRELSKLAA